MAANYGPVRHYLDARARVERAAAEVAALQERTTELQSQLGKLSQSGYLEDLARQQLTYALPGEELYVVTDTAGAAEAAAAGAGESEAAGQLAAASEVGGASESFVSNDASLEEIAAVVTEIVGDRLGAALSPGVLTILTNEAVGVEEQIGEVVGSAVAGASSAVAGASPAAADATTGEASASAEPGLLERILLAVASFF